MCYWMIPKGNTPILPEAFLTFAKVLSLALRCMRYPVVWLVSVSELSRLIQRINPSHSENTNTLEVFWQRFSEQPPTSNMPLGTPSQITIDCKSVHLDIKLQLNSVSE